MKTPYTIIFPVLLYSFVICGCSRKALVSNDNEAQYKIYSQQLEADYSITENTLSASTEALPENINWPEMNVASSEAKVIVANERTSFTNITKSTKNKLVYKLITKRVEKLLKKQESNKENSDSGNIIAGIIIGALGLILIGIAAGTAAPVLVYVGGVVLFVAGIILLLTGVL